MANKKACWTFYEADPSKKEFPVGSFSAAVAGDRSEKGAEKGEDGSEAYGGARIISRLKALKLPHSMGVGSRDVFTG